MVPYIDNDYGKLVKIYLRQSNYVVDDGNQ